MSVTARVQELARLLNKGRIVTREMLEALWGCSPETVHRLIDKARSPEYGIPVEYDRARGCYILQPGKAVELPGVWFPVDEIAALLGLSHWLDVMGSGVLKEKLEPVRSRMEAMLREHGLGMSEWKERIRLLPMQSRTVHPEILTDVVSAVLKRKRVAFEYKGASEAVFRLRKVSPQTVVRYRDNWYVDAWCHERRGLRQFSLSRMRAFRVLPDVAKEIPRSQLDGHFAGAYGIFAGRPKHKAVLVFEGGAENIVRDEIWHPKQRVDELSGGRIRFSFPCNDVRELARDVMRFADEVTVEGPEALREAVAEMVRRAAPRMTPQGNPV
jgi:proteasome accessory factor C